MKHHNRHILLAQRSLYPLQLLAPLIYAARPSVGPVWHRAPEFCKPPLCNIENWPKELHTQFCCSRNISQPGSRWWWPIKYNSRGAYYWEHLRLRVIGSTQHSVHLSKLHSIRFEMSEDHSHTVCTVWFGKMLNCLIWGARVVRARPGPHTRYSIMCSVLWQFLLSNDDS